MQLKSWLRVISTHVSKWNVQAYFDEFVLESIALNLNRIFFKTLQRMIVAKPFYLKNI